MSMFESTVAIVFPDFPSGEIVMKVQEIKTLAFEVTVNGSVVAPTNCSYEVFNADGVTSNTGTLQVIAAAGTTSCDIRGLAIGAARIKLTVTVTDHGNLLSASSYVAVVVSSVTDALMSMTDAYKLFGWLDSYFSVPTGNRRTTFQISEANNIYQASCTAASHLRLKASKELILGDNITFVCTRGNTFNVTVNLNDKSDKSDKAMTGHGVTNFSIIGVASQLELEAFSAHEDEYYSYDKSPGTGMNYVYLPKLKSLHLDYGRVTSWRYDRAISLEFMGLHDDGSLRPDKCQYANYTEIQKNQIFSSVLGRELLPEEKNLGLLNEYFRDKGKDDTSSCMEQYHKIRLPGSLLADPTLDTGGANILQFMHGKGRLAYDYMDGAMKTFLKSRDSNILMYVGPIVTESVACAAFVKLEYYAFMITNQVISPWHFNTDVVGLAANITRSLCKVGCDYNGYIVHTTFGTGVMKSATEMGTSVYKTELGTAVSGWSIMNVEEFSSFVGAGLVVLDNATGGVFSTTYQILTAGSAIDQAAMAKYLSELNI